MRGLSDCARRAMSASDVELLVGFGLQLPARFGGGLLGGAAGAAVAFGCDRPGRPGCSRRGRSWRGRRRFPPAAHRPATASAAPAAIPAAGSWHPCRPCAAAAAPPSTARTRAARPRGRHRSRHRGRSRRPPPPAHRRGSSRGGGRRSSFRPGQRQLRAEVQRRGRCRPARIRAPVRRARGSARLRRPCGQRAYSASATIRLTSASPRNSRRSLCGAPALRWVRACASRPGSAKAWCRSNVDGHAAQSVRPPLAQVLGRVELADHVEVGDDRLADFVVHVHLPAVVDALDLDVLLASRFRHS